MNLSKHLRYFLIITFSLSVLTALVAQLVNSTSSNLQLIRMSAMLIPSIGVLIMKFAFKSPVKTMGWNRFPLKWVLPALLMIPLAIHVVNLPLVAHLNGNQIPWQDWLYADSNGIYHSPENRSWGDLNSIGLFRRIVVNALIGLSIVSVLAFFEEIGWRVWMLPRLMDNFGVKAGILISAIIWALWHLPFVFGGINTIPGISLMAMTILYPVGPIGAGIVISWLWHNTQSIWIICLAHGALNNWGQYAFKYMKDGPADQAGWPWLYTGVNGALLLIGIVILLSIKPKTSNHE